MKKEKKIVILHRGWVVVGDVSQEGDQVVVDNASVVRRWGTSKGLGELATNGPLKNTVLDPCPTVRAPGSNVAMPPTSRDGSSQPKAASTTTLPVKYSGAPTIFSREPWRMSSDIDLLLNPVKGRDRYSAASSGLPFWPPGRSSMTTGMAINAAHIITQKSSI